MRIEHLLPRIPSEQVGEIAALYGIPCEQSIFKEQVKQISAYYTRTNVLKMLGNLTVQELDCIRMLASFSSIDETGLSYHAAAKKINELLDVKGIGEKMINKLCSRGLLFIYKQYWKDYVTIPDKVWPLILGLLADEIADKLTKEKMDHGKIQVAENNGLSIHHDMITLLAAIAHEPIDVSVKGFIYKRSATRINKLFRSSEDRFPKPHEADLPRNFFFVQQFVEYQSLTDMQSIAKIRADVLEPFLCVPYSEWSAQFLKLYLQVVYYPNNLPVALIYTILFELGKLDRWIDTATLVSELSSLLGKWGISLTKAHMNLICFDPLIAFGLMQWGHDERGSIVFKLTPWGALCLAKQTLKEDTEPFNAASLLTDHLFVQPNLEIVVPENIAPAIRWQVEALAELKQADTTLIYELTRKRILQAAESGWTIERIQAFFDRFSKVPVAPNVYKTIESWIGNFGKAALWDVIVLQFEDPNLAETLRHDKKMSPYIVQCFSPTAWIINRSDEEKVRALLSKLGYPIPIYVNRPGTEKSNKRDRSLRHYGQGDDKQFNISAAQLSGIEAFLPDRFKFGFDIRQVAANRLEYRNDNDLDDDEYDE